MHILLADGCLSYQHHLVTNPSFLLNLPTSAIMNEIPPNGNYFWHLFPTSAIMNEIPPPNGNYFWHLFRCRVYLLTPNSIVCLSD